jgi:hypothetical protein
MVTGKVNSGVIVGLEIEENGYRGKMFEWLKRFEWNHCSNCSEKTLCKRYWFTDGKEDWNKLMCRSCHRDMINKMKELRKKLLEKIDEIESSNNPS